MPDKITLFSGEYKFLSNFYECKIELDGIIYPTVEHAYQASKTNNINDKLIFSQMPTPAIAKRHGAIIRRIDDFDEIKLGIMENLIRIKFNNNNRLKELLISTGDKYIIENNTWHDNFFGSCVCKKCGDTGLNNLGKILMKIRGEINDANNM